MTARCRCGSSDLEPMPVVRDEQQNLIGLSSGDAGLDGRLTYTHRCRACGARIRVCDPESTPKEGACAS
jgi:hypothetical protein